MLVASILLDFMGGGRLGLYCCLRFLLHIASPPECWPEAGYAYFNPHSGSSSQQSRVKPVPVCQGERRPSVELWNWPVLIAQRDRRGWGGDASMLFFLAGLLSRPFIPGRGSCITCVACCHLSTDFWGAGGGVSYRPPRVELRVCVFFGRLHHWASRDPEHAYSRGPEPRVFSRNATHRLIYFPTRHREVTGCSED